MNIFETKTSTAGDGSIATINSLPKSGLPKFKLGLIFGPFWQHVLVTGPYSPVYYSVTIMIAVPFSDRYVLVTTAGVVITIIDII